MKDVSGTDANIALVQSMYAAFSRGDIPAILQLVSADVQFDNSDSAEMPYRGTYRGKDGVGKFFADIGGAVEVTSFEPKMYLASGDDVMTTGAWSGIARNTGRPFKSQWAMRFVVKNGKATYAHVYEDTAVTAAAFRS